MSSRWPRRDRDGARTNVGGSVSAVAAAWLVSIGFDFLLHGGLLASLYVEPGPFLLPPAEALRRIPLGYLAFLILTVALWWLLRALRVTGAMRGAWLGAAAGFVVWGALAVGLYSISTAPISLLLGWWLGQTVELALAGAVLGSAAAGTRLRRIWIAVLAATIAMFAAVVILQSVGLAPAVKSVPATQ